MTSSACQVPPEALRKQCGRVPAAVFNVLSLVQASMGGGHMACLASNGARTFHDILEFFVPCCLAVTDGR